MTTHSYVLAGRTPWTEEPGMLQSMGLQRVRYNLATEQQWQLRGLKWLSLTKYTDFSLILLYIVHPVIIIIHFSLCVCEWRILPAISAKMLQRSSHYVRAALMVSPEGTPDRNIMPPAIQSLDTVVTPPNGTPWGNSGWENTGYCPRKIRCTSKDWLQWAQTVASSHTKKKKG